MKLLTTIVLNLLISSAPQARADFSVQEYQNFKTQGGSIWQSFRRYLNGYGTGITYATWLTEQRHQGTVLFCLPHSLGFNVDNYLDVIDREISFTNPKEDDSIEVVLLYGMIRLFPCDTKAN